MFGVDAIVLALVALGDLALLVHLRRRRYRRVCLERMGRSLSLAIWRENQGSPVIPVRPANRWFTRALRT
jgi:hypothetical protein